MQRVGALPSTAAAGFRARALGTAPAGMTMMVGRLPPLAPSAAALGGWEGAAARPSLAAGAPGRIVRISQALPPGFDFPASGGASGQAAAGEPVDGPPGPPLKHHLGDPLRAVVGDLGKWLWVPAPWFGGWIKKRLFGVGSQEGSDREVATMALGMPAAAWQGLALRGSAAVAPLRGGAAFKMWHDPERG